MTEKTILKNSRQKVRVDLREYRPSKAKISKKNGAMRSTTFRYDVKRKIKQNRLDFDYAGSETKPKGEDGCRDNHRKINRNKK